MVNEEARLQCEASGVPPPSLTWLKDGSPVASVSDGIQVSTFYFLFVWAPGWDPGCGSFVCVCVFGDSL